VIGQCLPKHRNEEFLEFPNTIAPQVVADLEGRLIVNNCATNWSISPRYW